MISHLFSKSPKNVLFYSTGTANIANIFDNASGFLIQGPEIPKKIKSMSEFSRPTTTTATSIINAIAASASATTATSTYATASNLPNTTPTTFVGKDTGKLIEVAGFFNKFTPMSGYSILTKSVPPWFETLIQQSAAEKRYWLIEYHIQLAKMHKKSIREERFGALLIVLYGKAEMVYYACKLFDELPSLNCPRTVISFNALLYACLNSKKFDKLEELFREVPRNLGIQPDVYSYNTVVKGLCEASDYDSALKVIEKMEGSVILKDVVSYNAVFEIYYQVNKMAEVEKLWRKMEEKGVIANVGTYNWMLRCLVKNDRAEEAVELVEKMAKEKVNPDEYTYETVIDGCARAGKLEEAKMLFGKMVAQGCYVTDQEFYSRLLGFALKDTKFWLVVFRYCMKARDWKGN